MSSLFNSWKGLDDVTKSLKSEANVCVMIYITQLGAWAQGATICVCRHHLTLSVCHISDKSCLEHSIFIILTQIFKQGIYSSQSHKYFILLIDKDETLYSTFVNVWVKWVMSRDISLLSVTHVTHVTLSHAPSHRYKHLSPSSLNSSD